MVRYYKPFDNNSTIYNFFKQKLKIGEFLLIDKVSLECKYFSKSIVSKELDFISDKKLICNTTNLLPYPKYYNQVDNQFCNQLQRRKLNEDEIEQRTSSFLDSADSKIILKSLEISNSFEDVIVVTEESNSDNDNKLHKKIPLICESLSIKCISLPILIQKFDTEIVISVS